MADATEVDTQKKKKAGVEDALKIIIDDGSKAAKTIYLGSDGQLVKQLTKNSFVQGFRTSHRGEASNYLIGLEKFSHHDQAPNALNSSIVSEQYTDLSLLNVHHALHMTGLEPCDVHVFATLPLSQFYLPTGVRNTENIQRKKANLTRSLERYSSESNTAFKIVEVTVFPESLPAAGPELESEDIEPFEISLIVDLGGTTLDVASVTGALEEISRVEGYDNIGCSIVYDEIRRKLESLNLPESDAYIEHFINMRKTPEKYKVADEHRDDIHKSVLAAVAKLRDLVVKSCKSVIEHPHRVFLIGGGAYLIQEELKSAYPTAEFKVIDDPQFALANSLAKSIFI